MKPYRVLYISPLPPPYGGIATWTEKIFRYGLEKGFDCRLVNTQILSKRKSHDRARVDLYEIKRSFSILASLFFQLVHWSPHMIHLNCCLSRNGVIRDFLCAVMVKCLGSKLVVHYRGNVPDFPVGGSSRLGEVCLINLIRLADLNIGINEPSVAFIDRFRKGKTDSRKLPNFIEAGFLGEKKGNKLGGRLQAVYVGGMSRPKGFFDIVRVAGVFPEITFHLVGSSAAETDLSGIQLPDNLVFHGARGHDDAIRIMCESDFMIFLSHSEGFPNAVLEAMAVGLPVVATRVGAVPEMVEEGLGGFLCDPARLDSAVEAVRRLMACPTLRTMGGHNTARVQREYLYETVVHELCEIYRGVTG